MTFVKSSMYLPTQFGGGEPRPRPPVRGVRRPEPGGRAGVPDGQGDLRLH